MQVRWRFHDHLLSLITISQRCTKWSRGFYCICIFRRKLLVRAHADGWTTQNEKINSGLSRGRIGLKSSPIKQRNFIQARFRRNKYSLTILERSICFFRLSLPEEWLPEMIKHWLHLHGHEYCILVMNLILAYDHIQDMMYTEKPGYSFPSIHYDD